MRDMEPGSTLSADPPTGGPTAIIRYEHRGEIIPFGRREPPAIERFRVVLGDGPHGARGRVRAEGGA